MDECLHYKWTNPISRLLNCFILMGFHSVISGVKCRTLPINRGEGYICQILRQRPVYNVLFRTQYPDVVPKTSEMRHSCEIRLDSCNHPMQSCTEMLRHWQTHWHLYLWLLGGTHNRANSWTQDFSLFFFFFQDFYFSKAWKLPSRENPCTHKDASYKGLRPRIKPTTSQSGDDWLINLTWWCIYSSNWCSTSMIQKMSLHHRGKKRSGVSPSSTSLDLLLC